MRSMLMVLGILMAMALQGAAGVEAAWNWRSPMPYGGQWGQITFGNNRFVALRDGNGPSLMQTSEDGTNWVSVPVPVSERLSSVTFVENLFIATGEQGAILTSPDGLGWTRRLTGFSLPLFDVAHGNGMYVACGYLGTLLTSPNGVDWTPRRPTPGPTWPALCRVVFGNGQFVALGEEGLYLTSSNGVDWQRQSWPERLVSPSALAFGNGLFVTLSQGRGLYSQDGVTWEEGELITGGQAPVAVRSIRFLHNLFVAVGSGGVAISQNGRTWTNTGRVGEEDLSDVAYGHGLFLSPNRFGGNMLQCRDEGGQWAWADFKKQIDGSIVVFGNGLFLRCGDQAQLSLSPDGVDWETTYLPEPFKLLAHGRNTFVAVGAGGQLYASTNGRAWTKQALAPHPLSCLAYGDQRFVAGGEAGTLLSSTNGLDWSAQASGTTDDIIQCAFGNNRYVAVSLSNLLISSDGQHWSVAPSPFGGRGLLAFGNGHFVWQRPGGMGYGDALTSVNGQDWTLTPLESGTTHAETALFFAEGRFVKTDERGGIFLSTDGVHWQGGPQAQSRLTGIAYGRQSFLVVGPGSVILQSDPDPFQVRMQMGARQGNLRTLQLSGSHGGVFRVECSHDLAKRIWENVATVSLESSTTVVLNIKANEPGLFFRAVLVPSL